jgi:hypothetical protein
VRALVVVGFVALASGCTSRPPTTPATHPVRVRTAEQAYADGAFLERSGRLAEAEQAFLEAHRLGHRHALWALARVVDQRGDLARAERLYRRCRPPPSW